MNGVREKVWREWKSVGLSEGARDGGAGFVRGLRRLMERLGVEGRMEGWIEKARAGGEVELGQVHEQVWREVGELLVMLEGVLGSGARERSLVEFGKMLEGALSTLTLGLVPPTVDQVLVSSVVRSRVPGLRVGFVMGAVEGQFPKVGEEDAIL